MITLYGIANSRAFRCMWVLEEMGCKYEQVPTDFAGGSREPAYMRLNPNGRVPCLVDGDLVLFESLAINLYLARRYESPLWPSAIADEARMLQWTLWGTNELDPHLATMSRQGRLPPEQRNASAIELAASSLQAPLRVLEAHLATASYVIGSTFSLADLNLASVAASLLTSGLDLNHWEHVGAWLRRCLGRPAAQRCVALAMAARKS